MLDEALLDLIRPQLQEMVDERVHEQLRLFEPPPPEPWMTTDQAAKYLQLSEQALRKRARRPGFPAHQDDTGRWLFRREEIDEWLGVTRRSC